MEPAKKLLRMLKAQGGRVPDRSEVQQVVGAARPSQGAPRQPVLAGTHRTPRLSQDEQLLICRQQIADTSILRHPNYLKMIHPGLKNASEEWMQDLLRNFRMLVDQQMLDMIEKAMDGSGKDHQQEAVKAGKTMNEWLRNFAHGDTVMTGNLWQLLEEAGAPPRS